MNKIVAFGAGGLAGAVIGYLIADYLAYQLDEKAFEKEVRESLQELEPQIGGMDQELYEFEKSDNNKTDYSGKVKKLIKEKPSLEELVRPYHEEKEPYIMTLEEWEDDVRGFNRRTIQYYEMDGVFCNEQEEIEDDVVNKFGPNPFLHFGEGSEDPDVVYICNPSLSEMYEILRMKASYQADVLGEPAEEEKPKKARRTRKPRASQSGSKKEKEIEELGGTDDQESDES
jgi:gas vesicle protein